MKKQRVLVDSQSLPSFIGDPSEQAFDQRAGLCQAGRRDIVITTDPYDEKYLIYWQSIGYKLPHLVVAGPFESDKALSDLVFYKPEVQREIFSYLKARPRLEFFHPSSREKKLASCLGIPSYMNFDFAEFYQQKNEFKNLFLDAKVPTLPFLDITKCKPDWKVLVSQLGSSRTGYIAKNVLGSGGAALGMILKIRSRDDYENLPTNDYIIEPCVKISQEIAVHWKIGFGGKVKFLGFFEQIAHDLSYVGAKFPVQIEPVILEKLEDGFSKLTLKIAELGGLGYMCCDVIVDHYGNIYWSDLNPRKGAIIFVRDAVKRLVKKWKIQNFHAVHKHISKTRFTSFEEVEVAFSELLNPQNETFILVTNPGAIKYGYLDLTVISRRSSEAAMNFLNEVMKKCF